MVGGCWQTDAILRWAKWDLASLLRSNGLFPTVVLVMLQPCCVLSVCFKGISLKKRESCFVLRV